MSNQNYGNFRSPYKALAWLCCDACVYKNFAHGFETNCGRVLEILPFLPCDAMRCTVLVIVILSVRPSVRLSVTLVDCVHIARPTIMISSPYGSHIILVSGDIKFIPKFEPERERWMRVGWVLIGDFRPISRRICEIRQRLLLITNRKSLTRFPLVPKSTTSETPNSCRTVKTEVFLTLFHSWFRTRAQNFHKHTRHSKVKRVLVSRQHRTRLSTV